MKRKHNEIENAECNTHKKPKLDNCAANVNKDCLVQIFSFLPTPNDILFHVMPTCKGWYNIVHDEEHSLFRDVVFGNRTELPLKLQDHKPYSHATITMWIDCMRKTPLKRFALYDTVGASLFHHFNLQSLQKMVDYNLFVGIEELVLNDGGIDQADMDTLNSVVTKLVAQCAPTLKVFVPHKAFTADMVALFLKDCRALKEVTMIGSVDVTRLNGATLPSVEILHMSMWSGEHDASDLFRICPNLIEVDWGEGDYNPIDSSHIATIGAHCPKFESITFGARYLKELDLISGVANHIPNIKEITITDGYYFSDEMQLVGQNCKKLEKFVDRTESEDPPSDLLNNVGSTIKHLEASLEYDSYESLLEGLPQVCPNLQFLDLSFLPLDEEECLLMDLFDKFPSLKAFQLLTPTQNLDMEQAAQDENVEIEFRTGIINSLVNEKNLRTAELEPVISVRDYGCLYKITNVHAEWFFEVRFVESTYDYVKYIVERKNL